MWKLPTMVSKGPLACPDPSGAPHTSSSNQSSLATQKQPFYNDCGMNWLVVERVWNVMACGWCTGGEVKGNQANGVVSQYSCTLSQNVVYPALLPTIKTYDKLPSSMVSCELSSKIRQFQHHCFHITLNLLLTEWFQLFPVLWYDIFVNCNWVDTR
jgi:hypothetical protein